MIGKTFFPDLYNCNMDTNYTLRLALALVLPGPVNNVSPITYSSLWNLCMFVDEVLKYVKNQKI